MIEYDYYEDGYIEGNKKKEKLDKQLCYKQKQTEAEALELTYSHLGRLIQSAEMLAYKLNLINKNISLKYQTYDSFDIADKKDIDTLKYDVINFLDFYEKAIIIHKKNYEYENPDSISQLINDLNNWKRKALKNDKRFFSTILDLIQKGSYDNSVFPDEDILYEKAKKDNSKFKKNASFWKSLSIPILQFLSNLMKNTKENVKNNPKYKPDIHFGSKATNNKELKDSYESYKKESEIKAKLYEINNIISDIIQKNINTNYLVNAINELKDLYTKFKKEYGYEIQFDKTIISSLNNSFEQLKLIDNNTFNMLKKLTIEIDESLFQ